MAHDNSNNRDDRMNRPTPADNRKAIDRQIEVLKQAPNFYNLLDLVPSECTWYITRDDMERHILKMSGEYLGASEVKFVTLENAPKASRRPCCYLWLRSDSRHLIDSDVKGDNQAFRPKVERYSPELKRFAEQFAPLYTDDGKPINKKHLIRTLQNINGSTNIVAIRLDLSRIVHRIFDLENRGFTDVYGKDASQRRCVIKCHAIYDKPHAGSDAQLTLIQITKSFENGRNRSGRPRPANMFRDRDRDRRDNRDYDGLRD